MDSRKASGIKEKILGLLNTLHQLPVSEQARLYAGELRQSVVNERFLVAVLATWNTGKSTFINALQGEPLLPMQNKETTHIVNRLCYANRRYVTIHFLKDDPLIIETVKSLSLLLGLKIEDRKGRLLTLSCSGYQDQRAILEMLATDDGYLDKYAEIFKKVFHEDIIIPFPDFDELRNQYRAIRLDDETPADGGLLQRWITLSNHFKERCLRKIQNSITEIELGVPLPLLKHGIQILDTPGAESFEQMRDEVLDNYIKFANCVVFIFRFDQPGATEDIEFRRIIHEYGIDDVFLVLNRIDGARDAEEQWDAIGQVRQNLHEFVKGQIFLYPVSSLGALIAKLSKRNKKGKTHPFISKHAQFVKRTDNEKFKSYYTGFQKFYEDLDSFLAKVDKFQKIIQTAINFISIEARNLEEQLSGEYQKKEKSAEFRKLLDNEKRLEEIWDEWHEEITKVMHRFQEEIEGTVSGEIDSKRIEAAVRTGTISRQEFTDVVKYGSSSVMNAVLTMLIDELRSVCEDWVNVKPIKMITAARLEEYVRPQIQRISATLVSIYNGLLEQYVSDSVKLSGQLHVRLSEWIEGLFPASSSVVKAGEIKPVPVRVPELTIPLPSFWGRLKEQGKRIFRRNEIEWREEYRDIVKEICSSTEHQLRIWLNSELSRQAQSLTKILDKILEEQFTRSRRGIREVFEKEHEKGYKIREALRSIEEKRADGRRLGERAEELRKSVLTEKKGKPEA